MTADIARPTTKYVTKLLGSCDASASTWSTIFWLLTCGFSEWTDASRRRLPRSGSDSVHRIDHRGDPATQSRDLGVKVTASPSAVAVASLFQNENDAPAPLRLCFEVSIGRLPQLLGRPLRPELHRLGPEPYFLRPQLSGPSPTDPKVHQCKGRADHSEEGQHAEPFPGSTRQTPPRHKLHRQRVPSHDHSLARKFRSPGGLALPQTRFVADIAAPHDGRTSAVRLRRTHAPYRGASLRDRVTNRLEYGATLSPTTAPRMPASRCGQRFDRSIQRQHAERLQGPGLRPAALTA